jgi:hypothetical protein
MPSAARVRDALGAAREHQPVAGFEPDALEFGGQRHAIAHHFDHADAAPASQTGFSERLPDRGRAWLHKRLRDVLAPFFIA